MGPEPVTTVFQSFIFFKLNVTQYRGVLSIIQNFLKKKKYFSLLITDFLPLDSLGLRVERCFCCHSLDG